MDAHKALIQNIFNGGTLIEIPFFQRSYVWKDDLWQRLLDDMEYVTKTRRPHFFGSIILKAGRKPKSGDLFSECKTLVDGQQRLTTFLIFMKVLCLKTGQTTVFDWQFRLMGQSLALRHGKNDIDAFERVMALTTAKMMENPAPCSRIIDAYNFFISNLDETKLDIMTIKTNTQFVVIDLNEDEDEQQIFDTLNSLGVNLTTAELLKNYFFSRETIREYEAKWVSIFEKDDDTKAYWDMELETGRIKRAMIDIFFDAYFQLFVQNRSYNVTNDDKLMYEKVDRLSQSYQHFINTYCAGDKNDILDGMHDYALCFMNTFQPDQCQRSIPSDFGVERLNVVIFGLKNTTLIPYVLFVAKNVSESAERNKIYGILESYIMRRMVVRASTKNYNRLFTSLILNRVLDADTLLEKLNNISDSTTYIPDDDELCDGFEKSKLVNVQSKGIIYMLESKIRPSSSSVALLGFNQYSLEHLMPKKWRNNWAPCATEELIKQRDCMVLTLGNLAIITQSLNASIRDAAWKMKKEGKGDRQPGLAMCASGLCTLYDALKKSDWNENEISARGKWLFSQAQTVWNINPRTQED